MHKYRVTIKERGEADEQERKRRSLHFDADNHDDLFQIISAVRSKKIVDHDKSAALATGLKLLSEVVLEKRRDPLFAQLSDPLRTFIQQLKAIPELGE